VVISKIKIKVRIPRPVVTLPILFDLVQPANEITVIKDKIPKKNDIVPTTLGSTKSLLTTLNGYPSVVINNTFVIAKIVTKRKLAAEVEKIMMLFTNRVSLFETRMFAMVAIENPASSELMVMTWFASLFQYSKGMSSMLC